MQLKAYVGSDVVSMCIIPVRVSHKQSRTVINTYALLDSCSQRIFLKPEVLKEMNPKGKGTTITVKTLNGEVTENSKVLEGLEVSNSSDFGQEIVRWLRLPQSYTRKDTSLDSNDIIMPGQLSQWKYLNKIKGGLCSKKDIKFAQLIEANCARASEP